MRLCLSQAGDTSGAYDDVVDQIYAQELACTNQGPGHFEIFGARCEGAGRMVVRNDDGMRVRDQGRFENFSWMHKAGGDRPLRNDLVTHNNVAGVEVEGNEVLGVVEFKRLDESLDVLGAAYGLGLTSWLLDERKSDLRDDVA